MLAMVRVCSAALTMRALERREPEWGPHAKDVMYEALDRLEASDPVSFAELASHIEREIKRQVDG